MKIAIVGSRGFKDYDKLSKFILNKIELKDIELVVSGGAMVPIVLVKDLLK